MTRKEALKQIAQRCMEGDEPSVDFVTLIDRPDLPVISACEGDLTSVAKLEAEILSSASIAIWNYDDHGDARMFWGARLSTKYIKVRATAPTEPLARLAALCLALAEMENE